MADLSKIKLNGTTYNLKDAAVPSWAKAANKPTYTASEVGALPETYTAPVSSVNEQTGAVVLTASDIGATTPYEITSGVGYSGSSSSFYIYLSNYYGNYTYTNFMIFVNRSQNINSTFQVYTLTNSMDNHLEISRSHLTINEVNSPTSINSGLYYGTMSAWSNNATITLVSAPKMTDIQTATAISNTLSSGTLIATINGTNIYAPAYTDADGVSY